MKPIRIKAWHKKFREMFGVKAIFFERKTIWLDRKWNSEIPLEDVILLQYTGLPDKDGRDIYAKNIIGYSNPDIIAVVEYGEYDNNEEYEDRIFGFGWYLDVYDRKNRKWEIERFDKNAIKRTRILGNTFENPELITK